MSIHGRSPAAGIGHPEIPERDTCVPAGCSSPGDLSLGLLRKHVRESSSQVLSHLSREMAVGKEVTGGEGGINVSFKWQILS